MAENGSGRENQEVHITQSGGPNFAAGRDLTVNIGSRPKITISDRVYETASDGDHICSAEMLIEADSAIGAILIKAFGRDIESLQIRPPRGTGLMFTGRTGPTDYGYATVLRGANAGRYLLVARSACEQQITFDAEQV